MRYADIAGGRIAYEEAGAGPNVLVLLHGNFGSPRWWKPVLERVPPGFRAIAPVLRGCAGSPAPSASYAITDMADDLLALVESLALRRFHLVGHSLGGAVAMQFAIEHPDRLRSLLLAASAPASGLAAMREGDGSTARALRRIDAEHAPSVHMVEMAFRLQRAFGVSRAMLRAALDDMVPVVRGDGATFEELVDDAARMDPRAVAGFFVALHRFDVERRLARVKVPTLVLAGGRDAIVPSAALARTARLFPRAELVSWPDAGHAPMLESPDAFMDLLVGFATRHAGALRALTWCWRIWRVVLASSARVRALVRTRLAAPPAGPRPG